MFLNGEQVGLVRQNARDLLNSVLPYKDGEPNYNVVCKDYGGSGTTCGFLCHWLLWRLGVSELNVVDPKAFNGHSKTIINRSESGFTYTHGENISRLRNNKFFVTAIGTNAWQTRNGPDTGDIIYIHEEPNGPQNTEHVFVFIEEKKGKWITGESGQEYGKWGKIRDDRQFMPGRTAKVTGNNPFRSIIGWLPLDQLDYKSPPQPLSRKIV